ncbi:PREDICTED: BTB/POZ domain-containing protein KCTD9-like [Priapulus caudatus]|uniref:BTB/POZ domain-containing protein KCTD9-like n=1 Tax=Priapulus caudatus TaxID=37621 RepID=A0ABM1FC68_PRICU|nr:PREDICTED: BTB/POZ domain-containing protein KCTD9-like [Priapulus caudatus]
MDCGKRDETCSGIPAKGRLKFRPTSSADWITLNIGGQCFTTTRSTLTRSDPSSMLARMFATNQSATTWGNSVDPSGAYLIDRSPRHFEPILNYLRHGQIVLDAGVNPVGVLEEARFFGLQSLAEQLESLVEESRRDRDQAPLSRRDVIEALITTTAHTELRFQGINLSGVDLSKLDLRFINFKYSVLQGANLAQANLSCCLLERADLKAAKLDGANLLGVKMLCANLEGASLKGCNFEDPAGSRANMEGANMKGVQMDGSQMVGVNLRVANLRNANLQNCDLRGAVLAGADLENCDLSGCDLQEANLRGANLKGVTFDLMVTPLHMSQTMSSAQ